MTPYPRQVYGIPSGILQTCLGLQGHLITNLPQAMLLLIIKYPKDPNPRALTDFFHMNIIKPTILKVKGVCFEDCATDVLGYLNVDYQKGASRMSRFWEAMELWRYVTHYVYSVILNFKLDTPDIKGKTLRISDDCSIEPGSLYTTGMGLFRL